MTATVPIGTPVHIRIAWRAFTTASPGLVACPTPDGRWGLAHAPTGHAVAYFEDPESAQAAAAKLVDIDWRELDPADRVALEAIRIRVATASKAVGGYQAHVQAPGRDAWPVWDEVTP